MSNISPFSIQDFGSTFSDLRRGTLSMVVNRFHKSESVYGKTISAALVLSAASQLYNQTSSALSLPLHIVSIVKCETRKGTSSLSILNHKNELKRFKEKEKNYFKIK